MSMFTLETRPSSPSRIGHAILVGVFCAVGVMFAARWFVDWESHKVPVGSHVTTTDEDGQTVEGVVTQVRGQTVLIKSQGKTLVFHPSDLTR